MLDTEALLLVDDHEPEVLGRHVAREQPVRADQDVDLARGEALERGLLLRVGAEARQHLDAHGERLEPLREVREVLLREDRRRAQHHDLLAVLRRLEGGADRDLGLAVAHVAADQPVHRLVGLHVDLHVGDRRELVRRLLEREHRLHLELPRRVARVRVAGDRRAPRVEVDQVECELRAAALRALPVARHQSAVLSRVTRGAAPSGPDVLGDAVDLLDRDVELVALRVLEQQVVALGAEDLLAHDLAEQRDAVRGVHDVVARRERERDPGRVDLSPAAALHRARVDVVDADDGQPRVGDDEARGHVDVGELDEPGSSPAAAGASSTGRVVALLGHARRPPRRARRRRVRRVRRSGHGERDAVARGEERAHAAHEPLFAAGDLRPARGELGVDTRHRRAGATAA